MKVAILHSGFTEGNNGAERLCYEVAKMMGARIFTCSYDEKVNMSYPGIEKMIVLDPVRHPDSFTWKNFEIMRKMTDREDIDGDIILYSGNLPIFRVRKDRTPYVYFCHTPERGLYDMREELDSRMKKWGFPKYWISRFLLNRRRSMDQNLFRKIVNPLQVVTNSRLIMKRYENAYGLTPRKAIGAPVDTSKFRYKEPEDFFFTASGLRFNKRIDWQIRAAARAGVKLIIAGDGDERDRLEELSIALRGNVEFLGQVEERVLLDHYSRCRAFIFSAKDEDFGLVPVEALASGKPVICVNEGGPLEYLNHSNSFLYRDVDGLADILSGKNDPDFISMKENCLKTASYFDVKVFIKRLRAEMKTIMEEFY